MNRCIPPLFCFLFPLLMTAQVDDPYLQALNGTFHGAVIMKVDKQGRLVMDFHDDGKRFRQDIAPVHMLDPDLITYSPEENAIVLNCRQENSHCLTKEVFKLGLLRSSSRSTLPCPPDDVNGVRSIVAMETFLKGMQSTAAATPTETPRPSTRIKGR
ncbi:MAG: hypothetical protein R2818_02385 [Flavobacteriales bacterium]